MNLLEPPLIPSLLRRFLERSQVKMTEASLERERFLDFFLEERQLNIYAGELMMRPPGAPTTGEVCGSGPVPRRNRS